MRGPRVVPIRSHRQARTGEGQGGTKVVVGLWSRVGDGNDRDGGRDARQVVNINAARVGYRGVIAERPNNRPRARESNGIAEVTEYRGIRIGEREYGRRRSGSGQIIEVGQTGAVQGGVILTGANEETFSGDGDGVAKVALRLRRRVGQRKERLAGRRT